MKQTAMARSYSGRRVKDKTRRGVQLRIIDCQGKTRRLGRPTRALPGTAEKVAILAERARLGLALWHPDDEPPAPMLLPITMAVEKRSSIAGERSVPIPVILSADFARSGEWSRFGNFQRGPA